MRIDDWAALDPCMCDMCLFLTDVFEDRWTEEESHLDTRQVVEFNEPDEGLCWRCVFAPETTAVGLCAPCFDAVRTGESADVR